MVISLDNSLLRVGIPRSFNTGWDGQNIMFDVKVMANIFDYNKY